MSYCADISFKKIDGSEIGDFFVAIKKAIISSLDVIASANYLFMPSRQVILASTKYTCPDYDSIAFDDKHRLVRAHDIAWVERVFQYRWFYDSEWKLLGVYGVPSNIRPLFDGTVCFQNSCDQDYGMADWKGIEAFEKVFLRWQSASDEEIVEFVRKKYDEDVSSRDLDYERRYLAYQEIWERYAYTLNDDTSVVYISMFGSIYDSLQKEKFLRLCFDTMKKNIL